MGYQVKSEMLQGGAEGGYSKIEQENPWLTSTPLVVKPDQLIKRRGKAGLLAVNKTWPEVKAWISERMDKTQKVWIQNLSRTFPSEWHAFILSKFHTIFPFSVKTNLPNMPSQLYCA